MESCKHFLFYKYAAQCPDKSDQYVQMNGCVSPLELIQCDQKLR